MTSTVCVCFFPGRAGVGKSFWLGCIDRYVCSVQLNSLCTVIMHCCFSSRYLAKMNVKMLIAAPTGCAAFNVNGSTLHSLLQLPVPMDPNNPAPTLQGDQLKRLQFELKDAKILVCGIQHVWFFYICMYFF